MTGPVSVWRQEEDWGSDPVPSAGTTRSPEEAEEVWRSSRILRRTPYTITDYEEFRRNLEEVRERGYALDNEENETGVRCVAASLRDYSGRVRYAFSISAPVHRMYNDRIAELARYILEAKKEIQRELQY